MFIALLLLMHYWSQWDPLEAMGYGVSHWNDVPRLSKTKGGE